MIAKKFNFKKIKEFGNARLGRITTSKGNIEQSVGRILRKKEYDVEPLVVDLVDNFSAFVNQGKKRMTFYKKKKYEVKTEFIDLE